MNTPLPFQSLPNESPAARFRKNKLLLGLFLPFQSGGWTPSLTPRVSEWSFEHNARLTQRAEHYGFDLVFGISQWLPAGGFGGEMRFNEQHIDPITTSAALAALTKEIAIISTVHVLYGPWHPLHLAKFGATIDHIANGRWGVNVVTGFKESEFRMFGNAPIEHDLRYEMAEEFMDITFQLWKKTGNLTYNGRYWQTENAFVSPKPRAGRPIIVNAGSSEASIRFAARNSDIIFTTSPGGAHIDAACETLPRHIDGIRRAARAVDREIRVMVNPHIISRPTEAEARRRVDEILNGVDQVALVDFARIHQVGDTGGWKQHTREGWALGGNIQIIGSPQQVVDSIIRLHEAGCDGLQLCFFDFAEDLEFFGLHILPLLKEAGLRT